MNDLTPRSSIHWLLLEEFVPYSPCSCRAKTKFSESFPLSYSLLSYTQSKESQGAVACRRLHLYLLWHWRALMKSLHGFLFCERFSVCIQVSSPVTLQNLSITHYLFGTQKPKNPECRYFVQYQTLM